MSRAALIALALAGCGPEFVMEVTLSFDLDEMSARIDGNELPPV